MDMGVVRLGAPAGSSWEAQPSSCDRQAQAEAFLQPFCLQTMPL